MDTSALMAVLLDEPEGEVFQRALYGADALKMSVSNWLEAFLVLQRYGQTAIAERLDRLIDTLDVRLVLVDVEQVRLARAAGLQFGRGRHKAALNYGDCFAYALSKVSGEPLLFKGNDFPLTDVMPALPA